MEIKPLWRTFKFDEVCMISSRFIDPRLPEYKYLPHIGNANIEKKTGKLLKYNLAIEDMLISGKYYFSECDVLYGKINPQFAKATFPKFRGICSADMYPLSCTENAIPQYLLYILLSKEFTDYTISVSMRSGMPKVNRDELYTYEVLLPSLSEQETIAELLSDIDDLIASQEKLIDKKKSIKQGAMQELLTGKKRLEGFSGEWVGKLVDELVNFENGKAHENSIIENGNYIVVNSKFISTNGEVKKYSSEPYLIANENDILMVMSDVPNGRAIAKCYLVEKDNLYTVNQRICKLSHKFSNMKFLFYKLDRNPYFLSFDDGAKQTNLRKIDILLCKIKVPPTIEEQTTIANILSDMGNEIEILEQKLNKYKNIKQGMMQELLTGRIRLVEGVVQ